MTTSARQVLSLDSSWRFHLGDIAPPLPNTHIAAYMLNKAGYARGAAKASWDDSDWRIVDLPHDWSIEGEFSPESHVDAGFLPRGVAWYRRHFSHDDVDRGRHLTLTFDGVATHCTVYVNGHLLHRNFCGYTPFTIDITDIARFRGDDDVNTIAVRVDATYAEGWWYEGAGIYRHVWLTKNHPLHIEPDGVFVTANVQPDSSATLAVRTRVRNTTDVPLTFELTCALHAGVERSEERAQRHPGSIHARSEIEIAQRLTIPNARLWSCDDPQLYVLRSALELDGARLEERTISFGIRTLRFDPNEGFFLNDRPLKLKGACNHQDHAGVGVAVPDSIHEFRIRRLKEMGCNAYRSAHHPPARELLDTCDRLGMLVIDENRNFGSSPQHLEQLRAMVLRDRNHPCVIAWSICNEEAIQGSPIAANIARAMTAEIEKLDPSRPIMAAVSGGILNDQGLADAMPLVGINYQLPVNDDLHAKKPDVPIIAAETHCVLSTRGTYATDPAQHIFASDDSATAPWGATARETWRFVSSRPHIAGLFLWSGFDYRGEPTPHAWPCVSSQFGMMDLCGFEKDAFFLHRAFFDRDGEPFVHLLPNWNSPGRDEKPIRVRAYTNCDDAELFLNGESLGRKHVDPIEMTEWDVPYRPGVLAAVGYRGDRRAAEARVETTGRATALGLEIHPSAAAPATLPADGQFALPITVFAIDALGRRVPTADHVTSFTLDGPGRIIGVGNGDPTSHEPNQAMSRSLFRGLAQVIVQMTTTPGAITLSANSPGLALASLQLESTAVVPSLATVLPAIRKHFLTDWRMSPITADRPDVQQKTLPQDVNSWERVEPGKAQAQWQVAAARGGGFAIYRATFTPSASMQSRGGRIILHAVAGVAEVLVNDVRLATKPTPAPTAIEVTLPPSSSTPVSVSVLIHATTSPAGLVGRVEIVV